MRCDCRKPGKALFLRAINDLDVDPLASYAIGDKVSDLIPAVELGATGVLLADRNGPATCGSVSEPFLSAPGFRAAVNLVLERTQERLQSGV